MHSEIALIICTRNNHSKLELTLKNLEKILPSGIQLVVVDQSTEDNRAALSLKIPVTYIRTPHELGLSRARNTAIQSTRASVLAWTDDDCIVTKEYLLQLLSIAKKSSTAKQQNIAGVCGRTEPYLPTKPSSLFHCPCTLRKEDKRPVTDVKTHWKHVGLGNNMVFFRYIFEDLGFFKEWLGVGSIGESGEDGEYMLRCLIAGKTMLYDDRLLIYHNRWLSDTQLRAQHLKYDCGGLAVYGYYSFLGVNNCWEDFNQVIDRNTSAIISSIREIKQSPSKLFHNLKATLQETYSFFKGLTLAVLFSKVLPSPEKKLVIDYRAKHG